jgi:thioredoxin-like negative regulator of GroEL
LTTRPGSPTAINVRGIPTLLVVRNGQEVDRLAGAPRKPGLEAWLERHLAAPAAT